MKKFVTGFVTGTTITVATLAGLLYGVKKTVIEPIEEKENMVEDNRRKAMRKSRAR
ncbi:DUF3042 family protein [Vagococcus salmoninarum]|uniref:DUF3042 domain-containing protein n=1 Tax=Vagococcus salmoninarum TaxID=2739 RepID=A0A429ZU53_9ENTE|nr:DUF3042 family protein [Vagococcus salmoninarum]MBE9388901.1 DUF3042 family protein [Vagococcus salmoninarum]RST97219.1 DUF3042 domain-containing protein [Vagococcus salmoninarum]